jgi:predicted small secreted protein
MRKPTTALVVAVLVVTACATQRGFEQLLTAWTGQDVNWLIAKWGPPNSTFQMPNGNLIYTYERSRIVTTPVYQTPTYTTPSRTTVNVIGDTAYATTRPGQTYGGQVYGGQTVSQSCRVDFTVEGSRIIAWRYEGNACRAQER